MTGRGPLVGAHMSAAGGLERAVERGLAVGCRTIQLFTRNSNQWAGKPVSGEEAAVFRAAAAKAGFAPLVSHSAYLINLGSSNQETLLKSRHTIREELERCHALNLTYLNFHPGAAVGGTAIFAIFTR